MFTSVGVTGGFIPGMNIFIHSAGFVIAAGALTCGAEVAVFNEFSQCTVRGCPSGGAGSARGSSALPSTRQGCVGRR